MAIKFRYNAIMPKKTDTPKPASTESTQEPIAVDPRLLEMLVCPKTCGPLTYDRKASELVSKRAKLAYPIRDGVPIMLIDEARKL